MLVEKEMQSLESGLTTTEEDQESVYLPQKQSEDSLR